MSLHLLPALAHSTPSLRQSAMRLNGDTAVSVIDAAVSDTAIGDTTISDKTINDAKISDRQSINQ